MSRFTPKIDTVGKFSVRLPWVLNPQMVYRVLAVKTLDDLAKLGTDALETIYKPMGLIDGQDGFSWANESANNPCIISLLDPTGVVFYIPDTFILSYPDQSGVPYNYIVLGLDLGALPDSDDLASLKHDLADYAKSIIGTEVLVTEHRIPSTTTPTQTQHQAFLAARQLNITQVDTLTEQIEILKQQLATVRATNDSLTKLVIHHNLIA